MNVLVMGAANPEIMRLAPVGFALGDGAWRIAGFLDNDETLAGTEFMGRPVLGSPALLGQAEYSDHLNLSHKPFA